MKLEVGLVEVYTGHGKGKTTAALGQALRSAGRGLTVYMVQFLKTDDTGEIASAKKLYPNFQIYRFERPRGFFWTLSDEEKAELKNDIDRAMEFCREVVNCGKCDMLILDEIVGAINNGLILPGDVIKLINSRPDFMEIILTGRDAPQDIMDAADLVTEMREVKHYFNKGIPGREGIEY